MDYWDFIDSAHESLAREFDDVDVGANMVVLALNRASSAITYDLESTVHRTEGSSWTAYRFLFVLWHAGPLSAHELAKLTNMTRTAVSNMTHPMIERGLVEKKPSEDDRRSVTLGLTAKGRDYIRQLFLRQNERESEWAASLSEIERELLIMLLRKLMTGQGVAGVRKRS